MEMLKKLVAYIKLHWVTLVKVITTLIILPFIITFYMIQEFEKARQLWFITVAYTGIIIQCVNKQ